MADINNSLNDFQKIIEILKVIQNKIGNDTDVVWTRYETTAELKNDLDGYIEKLHTSDYEALAMLNFLFGPTSSFQELSISNGWGDDFLTLANQFDYYHQRLISV